MKRKESYKDLALIAGNIANLYDDGIPLLNIIGLIDELPLKKEYKVLIKFMEKTIREGESLQEAFNRGKGLIPKFFISMVGIGEKTGKIVYVLKGLEIYYNKLQYINGAIISAVTYPLILISALIALGIFVMFFFIPNMSNIYGAMGKEIPGSYLKIISLKENILNNPIITIAEVMLRIIILPYYIVKIFLKKYILNIIERIPIYNLLNEYIVIVLISVVINSGINISIGLQYCSESNLSNKINKNIRKINSDITSGIMLSESMNETGMFSKYTLAHIKLGEESGSLDKRLVLLEEEIFKNLSNRINKGTQLIQPLLILIIGVVIVFFILKFVMPLLDIVLT